MREPPLFELKTPTTRAECIILAKMALAELKWLNKTLAEAFGQDPETDPITGESCV